MYLFFYIIHIQSNHESITTQGVYIIKKLPTGLAGGSSFRL